MKTNINEVPQEVALELVKASEITPKEVKWLWYPYIPFGKVTLLQGDPGDGKSQLMLTISAILSKGKTSGQTAAGLYAAKEAFLKAAGTGITSLDLCEIRISHDEKGAPFYLLGDRQKDLLSLRGADSAFLSITHEGGMAAALCVLEGC